MQGPALEHTTHAGAHGHACCSASRESSPPHLELMREGTHHTHGGPGASITRWAKRNHGQPRVSRTRVTSRRAIKSGHIIWEHTHVHTHSGFQDIDVPNRIKRKLSVSRINTKLQETRETCAVHTPTGISTATSRNFLVSRKTSTQTQQQRFKDPTVCLSQLGTPGYGSYYVLVVRSLNLPLWAPPNFTGARRHKHGEAELLQVKDGKPKVHTGCHDTWTLLTAEKRPRGARGESMGRHVPGGPPPPPSKHERDPANGAEDGAFEGTKQRMNGPYRLLHCTASRRW